MTSLRQHIEDLDVDSWARLTRHAAVAAVEADQRQGKTASAELTVVAGMSERELIELRNRLGPAAQRLSPVMQLVEADHLRAVAEHEARQAEQAKRDAAKAQREARNGKTDDKSKQEQSSTDPNPH